METTIFCALFLPRFFFFFVLQYSERLLESERKAAGARQKLEGAGEERLRLKQQSAPLGQGSGKEGTLPCF